jgi:uncharacterized protein (DUF427 family)
MPTASWNGAVIAEAPEQDINVVEGNVYFPLAAVRQEFLQPSSTTTICPWKGSANYFSLNVNGRTNVDAVWTYRTPKAAAKQIAGQVAFWKGVVVEP